MQPAGLRLTADRQRVEGTEGTEQTEGTEGLMAWAHLETAANGFACLSLSSWWRYRWLRLLLRLRYRFSPSGSAIRAPGQSVHRALVRGGLRVLGGWDDLGGYSLLADDPRTDEFLREFARKHGVWDAA